MMEEREVSIFFDMYPCEIKVVVTTDIGQSRNNRSEIFNHVSFASYKNVKALTEYGDDCSIIYLFFKNKGVKEGQVTHEAYHALMGIYKYMGVQEHDEEITAYSLSYIVDSVHKILSKHG